jgi:uncharacterized protein (DUF433 family)
MRLRLDAAESYGKALWMDRREWEPFFSIGPYSAFCPLAAWSLAYYRPSGGRTDAPKEITMNWRDHIVADPEVLAGKPVIKGTRMSVQLVLERLADGWSEQDLYRAYPNLMPESLHAVFAFASDVLRDEDYVARGMAAA